MKLERLPYSPGPLVDFYDEALTALGALCERTWHDRLEVVAEGPAARLWKPTGELHEVELWFPPPEDTAAREAAKEVFPGCPLTFQLAESLRPMLFVAEPAWRATVAAELAHQVQTLEALFAPRMRRWIVLRERTG